MSAPLAERLRPQSLDDIVGQQHLLGPGKPLRRIIESGEIPNMVFYGPPGVGKTTLASIIAKRTSRSLCKLNGTTASTSDIRGVISRTDTFAAPNGILLYLDEIQYLNKKQQQTLLEFIENGAVTLIASTTENPYFYVYGAILSRCTVFEFKQVETADILKAVSRAFRFLENEMHIKIEAEDRADEIIASSCGGDVRKAMNAVELCVLSGKIAESGKCTVTEQSARELTQRSAMRYDREGDEHYDLLSAFQKSMRGSDADAGVYYLARLLEAGDLASVCRRLLVCACEDVGLAYPQIIPIVKAAVDSALQVGLPEARIPLADAVILVCNSPKSNSAYLAVDAAIADVRAGKTGPVPRRLQNKHCDGADNTNKGQFYKYPHDFPGHWVKQGYLPENMEGTVYYRPGDNKTEQAFKTYMEKIKNTNLK